MVAVAGNQPGVVTGPVGSIWDRFVTGAGDLVDVVGKYQEQRWRREQDKNRVEWKDETERLQDEVAALKSGIAVNGQSIDRRVLVAGGVGLLAVLGLGLILGR